MVNHVSICGKVLVELLYLLHLAVDALGLLPQGFVSLDLPLEVLDLFVLQLDLLFVLLGQPLLLLLELVLECFELLGLVLLLLEYLSFMLIS